MQKKKKKFKRRIERIKIGISGKNLLYFSRKKFLYIYDTTVYVIRRIIYIGNPPWRVRPRHPPHYRKSTMMHTFASLAVL